MTGRQHYCKAERQLALAEEHRDTGDPRDHELAVQFTAEAQAHATLALTAATLAAGAATIPRTTKTAVWVGEVTGK